MKILKVIHGYPKLYNAGSEVYSQMLVHGLTKARHEVEVFTRYENPFEKDFAVHSFEEKVDKNTKQKVQLHKINIPNSKDRYRHVQVDRAYEMILHKLQPQLVHIGHLNHLSTGIVSVTQKLNIPLVYTLHDYWLMCPRGQFLQFNIDDDSEAWQLCQQQQHQNCAIKCYSRYFSGKKSQQKKDIAFWTNWVKHRMQETQNLSQQVDAFIAPSRHLQEKFIHQFGIKREKIFFLDYGFDLQRFSNRKRLQEKELVFGYIGTHIPAKGIQDLIQAFAMIVGSTKLRIWGRPRAETAFYLKSLSNATSSIEWMGEYSNDTIVEKVFNYCDVIVVPSIWLENSPLVIHEAQQLRVPVITANYGGMAEYVQDGVNGLLFDFRNYQSLAQKMQMVVDDRTILTKLSQRGYLFSKSGDIISIEEHVQQLEQVYQHVLGASHAL